MASIRMRDGKYQVNIRRRGYPTVTRTFTSRRAAKSWSKTTEIQMERGEFNPHSNITVEELIKRYTNEWQTGDNPEFAIQDIPIRRVLSSYQWPLPLFAK